MGPFNFEYKWVIEHVFISIVVISVNGLSPLLFLNIIDF